MSSGSGVEDEGEETYEIRDGRSQEVGPFTCAQCRQARRKCDRLLPSCSRCLDRDFVCDSSKRARRSSGLHKATANRQQEPSYRHVTQQDVISACNERVARCLADDLLRQPRSVAYDSIDELRKLQDWVASQINLSAASLPNSGLLEAIHRAASFHKSTPIGDGFYNCFDGTALIAFGLLAEEYLWHACKYLEPLDSQSDEDPTSSPSEIGSHCTE